MPCECSLDLPRTVKIERGSQAPIWYEYVEAPCIQMAYPEPGSMSTVKEIGTSGHGNKAMCADNRLPVAATICCDSDANPVTICTSVGERTTYQTTVDRCANYLTGYSTCAWDTVPTSWDCGTDESYWQGGKFCSRGVSLMLVLSLGHDDSNRLLHSSLRLFCSLISWYPVCLVICSLFNERANRC